MLIPITFSLPCSSSPKLPTTLAKVSHSEVVLLELQGSLQVESSHPSERDGQLVGILRIDDDLKRSTLQIGHHLIEGKVTTLPKPLAILHRSTSSASTSSKVTEIRTSQNSSDRGDKLKPTDSDEDAAAGEDPDVDDVTMDDFVADPVAGSDASDSEPEPEVKWDAIAVVKRKIVFSKRPMPIVGRLS